MSQIRVLRDCSSLSVAPPLQRPSPATPMKLRCLSNATPVECCPRDRLHFAALHSSASGRVFAAHRDRRRSLLRGQFAGHQLPVCRSHGFSSSRRRIHVVQCRDRKVNMRLRLDHQVNFGEKHALVGASNYMGSWEKPVEMTWTEEGWVADIEATAGDRSEYKFVIVTGDGKIAWESGSNRVLEVPEESGIEVVAMWENPEVVVNGGSVTQHEDNSSEEKPQERKEFKHDHGSSGSESMEFSQGWKGKDINFMKSNEHSGRVGGTWDVTGLEGPAKFVVEGDKKSGNWWRKLEVVRELLTSDLGKANRLESLVYSSTYLKWINTGQIPCFEDGGHYRPNKHAEISRLIFRELERMYSEKSISPEERVVIRKTHPSLPSFKAEFTAAVPLTRIRDIAHRNDIPHDLKQEIKHTIQNKLHRNAGPEDLVATEALLARVTKTPGEYSAAFLEQLKIFHRELKDFFNASSLTEQLDGLRPSLDEQQLSALEGFVAIKKKLDEAGDNASTDSLLECMHALTGLRAVLLKGLDSGLRNDASDEAIAMRQKWRLSEIGLEDYFFVLFSRFLNGLDKAGGAKRLIDDIQSRTTSKWKQPLGAVVLGIRQLGLSGWEPAECLAIENELTAWEAAGIVGKGSEEDMRLWGLRLKATLDRTHRLSESYSDTLLQLYPVRTQKLGNALGIPENTIRTYAEAEIRASVVFQLSKLTTLLVKAIRSVLHTEGWDIIMAGSTCGKLVEVEKIVPGSLPSSADGPVVLLVKESDGDEEVRAAGPNVAGVILQHELPHLSHLGVRARQEKVVFVTCDDEDKVKEIRSFLNKTVRLEATSDGVRLSSSNAASQAVSSVKDASAKPGAQEASVSESKVTASGPGVILDLADATLAKAGAKATACGKLAKAAEMSAKEGKSKASKTSPKFLVPPGNVIPFGAMEAALESSGSIKEFRKLLEDVETAQVEGGKLDEICNKLRNLVAGQRLPKSVLSKIAKDFPSGAKLIVRSSANVEDLAGMSGAGLYDSIPNVNPSDPENFCKAVAGVWASLYTRRAILSRRVAKVPQKAAAMAVLVQQLLAPDLSFVLHTVDPINRDENVVHGEIASGLGETLASGTKGTPWRISVHKNNGTVKLLAFANFSQEFVAGSDGLADGKVQKKVVDYSKKKLSLDLNYASELGQRLAAIGSFLEKSFDCPQDVEGCVVGEDIYIVQTRPQP